jgi:hypothetical protein
MDLENTSLTEERSGIKSSTESDRVVQSDGLYVRRDNARLGPVRKGEVVWQAILGSMDDIWRTSREP